MSCTPLYMDGVDLDGPIYRIVRPPVFQALLRGELVLSHHSRWDDKWEAPFSRAAATWDDGQLVFIGGKPTFGTCWSALADSDTLWRAYSWVWLDDQGKNKFSDSEGIRLHSTARRLSDAIAKGVDASRYAVYVCKVNYRSAKDLGQVVADWVGHHRGHFLNNDSAQAFMTDPQHSAEFHCWKRSAYEHEHEIRVLAVDKRPVGASQALSIRVDPNEIVSDVAFDPRIAEGVNEGRKREAQALGYTGTFSVSELYRGALFQVPMPRPRP